MIICNMTIIIYHDSLGLNITKSCLHFILVTKYRKKLHWYSFNLKIDRIKGNVLDYYLIILHTNFFSGSHQLSLILSGYILS